MWELFPTHVRATAVAFCNGSGPVFTSFGPLVAGLLVLQLGGLSNATGIMTSFAVLSIVAVLLGRETGTSNCHVRQVFSKSCAAPQNEPH
jgi:hypothetical protein